MNRVTLSTLGAAALCPGSAVLPRSDGVAGAPGSALHEYSSILLGHGREAADAALDRIAERWGLAGTDESIVRWRARYYEPDVPAGALSEQALCLMEDGSVVEVVGARGRYEMPDGGVIAGTVDLIWSEPEPLSWSEPDGRWRAPLGGQLWAVDLKTGARANVSPAAKNWQVKGSALLAARYVGLPSRGVVGALNFLPRSSKDDRRGEWDSVETAWTEDDLSDFEQEIRGIVARVRASERAIAEGHIPELIAGPHCTYCTSRLACPAYAVEARALMRPASDGRIRLPKLEDLSREDLARAAAALPDIERAARGLRDLLVAAVEQRGPIPLGDGRVWGPESAGTKEEHSTRILYQELRDELEPLVGEDRAGELADKAFEASSASVERAVRTAMGEAGEERGLSRHMGAIKARVRERGGARQVPAVKWRAHHPGATAVLPKPTDGTEAADHEPH